MIQDDARVFATMAACFHPATRERWEEMTSERAWSDLIEDARDLVGGARLLGEEKAPAARARQFAPLQEFLTPEEVNALFVPPSYDELVDFSNRRFAGGVPGAAVPVESLYVVWTEDPSRGAFAGRTGLYMSDAALYMRDLLKSFELQAPEEFAATPDHLSLELEMLSFLLDAGQVESAREFLIERFAWLTIYRPKLVELGDEALFFLAIVDALLGMRACVSER